MTTGFVLRGENTGCVRSLTVLLMLLIASFASASNLEGSDSAKVQSVLRKRLPQIEIEKVQPSSWPGLFEVITANELIYSNASGDLLFIGKILDTTRSEDLTTKRWNELQQIDFKSLPFKSAILKIKGNGSRKLAVFADPLCPFCVKLETALESVTDVTIYTFLLPIEALHSGATTKARSIWCATDRAVAWSNWMVNKVEPMLATCVDDPVDELVMLAEKLKVSGTPTLFFQGGNRVAGALTTEQIEQALGNRVSNK